MEHPFERADREIGRILHLAAKNRYALPTHYPFKLQAEYSSEQVMCRHLTLSMGATALVALFWVMGIGTPEKKALGAEQGLMEAVNRERKERSLSILKWDEGLARAAHKHAELMAEQSVLEHQLPDEPELAVRAHDAGARFSHITENIGMADLASKFHEGWMHSPGHRANILDPQIDSIGIAVVEGEEHLFAVEDFALAVEALSFEEQQERVVALLKARGLSARSTNDAAKNCEAYKQSFETQKRGYITQYETPDLSRLPKDVERELQRGHYKSATVTACPQKETIGFTSFRIIILLN